MTALVAVLVVMPSGGTSTGEVASELPEGRHVLTEHWSLSLGEAGLPARPLGYGDHPDGHRRLSRAALPFRITVEQEVVARYGAQALHEGPTM